MDEQELKLLREIEKPGSQSGLVDGKELQASFERLSQRGLITRSYGEADALTEKGHEALLNPDSVGGQADAK